MTLLTSVFDLRSWNMWSGTHINFRFWGFCCIERWSQLKTGIVSEIDLQHWTWPHNCDWPPILIHVKWNPHLFMILYILVYWTLKSVKKLQSSAFWQFMRSVEVTWRLWYGRYGPGIKYLESCGVEPTFIFDLRILVY